MAFAAEAGQTQALRVEFFGDTIESIRTIDLDSQVSTHQLSAVSIISATCGDREEQRELFLNILPAEGIVILDELFANLDVKGRENVAALLTEEGRNRSVFVIDHNPTLESYTDHILQVSKENEVTQIQEV